MSKVGAPLDHLVIPLLSAAVWRIATHHLNPFCSRKCQQNTHFTEISKRKQSSPCTNSHQRCFETTNFDSNFDGFIAKIYCSCRGIKHIVQTHFLAQYLNKTHILT